MLVDLEVKPIFERAIKLFVNDCLRHPGKSVVDGGDDVSVSCSKDVCEEVVGEAVEPFSEGGNVVIDACEASFGLG